MRSALLSALIIVVGLGALAQAAPGPSTPVVVRPGGYGHPPAPHCCKEKVWDATGKEIGDLLDYDNSYGPQQLVGYVAYRLKGGDAVTLKVTPEVLNSLQGTSTGNTLFTTPDCSGNTLFAGIAWPPLAKRYAMVILSNWTGSPNTDSANAWLFVSDALPHRVIPGAGTVFHSQWGDTGCSPFPAPGFTVTNWPGGFWMHRVENLFAKFKRPFYVDY